MFKGNFMAGLAGWAVLGLGLTSTITAAGEAAAAAEPRHRFAIGAGQWGVRSPLQGTPQDDARTGYFPWISYENQWLSIDPSALAVRALDNGHIRIEVLVAPRWVLADPQDSTLHNDLRRRTSIDAGARFSASASHAMFSLTYRGDVSGRINGHEVTIETGVGLPLPGGGDFGLKGGAYWRDDNLNTSLYGVFPDEARTDRPAYAVRQGFTPFAGMKISYPVIGGLQAVLAAEAEYLNDASAASPIIARRIVPSAMFGLFYSFGVQ
jgi:outer membrane scaffolding protein for murein synthesis (MipA/OmpV family)